MEINTVSRIKKFQQKMAKSSLAVFYSGEEKGYRHPFRSNSDFFYLTGLHEPGLVLIVMDENAPLLFRDEPSEVMKRWNGELPTKHHISENLSIPEENILNADLWQEKLKELSSNRSIIYFDFTSEIAFSQQVFRIVKKNRAETRGKQYSPDQIIHSDTLIHPLRMIKDASELAIMKEAALISANAHNRTMEWVWENKPSYEYEVRAFIEKEFYVKGAEGLAYPSIVAAGNNATYLHYPRYDGSIQSGDLILIDAGCEYQSYASDITRTFPFSGKLSSAQNEIYSIVLKAQEEAISKSVPGNTLDSIHNTAVNIITEGLWHLGLFKKIPDPNNFKKIIRPSSYDEVIEQEYYKLFYMHKTSHYLGIDVHDAGIYYKKQEPVPLKKNMVFTVEPGIYIPKDYLFVDISFRGIGIRIEDNILVKAKGSQNLTRKARKIFET